MWQNGIYLLQFRSICVLETHPPPISLHCPPYLHDLSHRLFWRRLDCKEETREGRRATREREREKKRKIQEERIDIMQSVSINGVQFPLSNPTQLVGSYRVTAKTATRTRYYRKISPLPLLLQNGPNVTNSSPKLLWHISVILGTCHYLPLRQACSQGVDWNTKDANHREIPKWLRRALTRTIVVGPSWWRSCHV